MIEKTTARGFERIEFDDLYGEKCSLQQSSLAIYEQPGTGAVWLGVNDVGGKPARMHLNEGLVKDLIERLQWWLDTGNLYRGDTIFVFGSNLSGIHGAGAALHAKRFHGAKLGQGEGRQGSSYAIPTKDQHLEPLTLFVIDQGVQRFLQYAKDNPGLRFKVTRVGCGLAGKKDVDIAPMFLKSPENCFFDPEWEGYGLQTWSENMAR